MAQKGVQVIAVEPGSLAEEAGIRPGDTLIQIHGEEVLDQLNYQYLITREDEAELVVQRPDGSQFETFVENGGEGIGVDLAQDEVKVCKQNCVFCFVHQMPKGFRKSLYLKDEDVRLSFLYGHFTTLSSSDDAELDRIVRERLSPIHVSVHATDPVARVKVVGNPKEGHILRKIDRLLAGGIDVHTQAVVAPGLNDGDIWLRTVEDLWARRREGRGSVLSLSCVPVGLTSHRENLPLVQDVDKAFARDWVARWKPEVRKFAVANDGEPWLLLADEWFTRAGIEVPGRAFYSRSWAQLENGVGLVRRFLEHSRRFIKSPRAQGFKGRRVLLLTGSSFAPTLRRVATELNDGEIWQRTLDDLWARRKAGRGSVLSLSCVPVGLTGHRENLPLVQDVGPAFARDWVARWTPEVRKYAKANDGEPWLLLADEWYTRAGIEVPGRAFYSRSWAQLENGVGL
ncbi:MAG TPA: DUF512 domain-containing protein, partial [Geothrix sp.]|nr:DUF512 domain-containing protein [Geothrix sp.]